MWVINEITQTVKELLLDGYVQDIIIITVITSSSVLSAFGALRHLYTFLHKRKQKKHTNITPSRTASQEIDELQESEKNLKLLFSDQSEQLIITSVKTKNVVNSNNRQKLEENIYSTNKENSPKCIKCDGGLWERHCVQGLCKNCCENSGGCQAKGHNKTPEAYLPWFDKSTPNNQVISISCMDLKEFPPRFGFHCMHACGMDASHNKITMIPENVTLMRGLAHIILSHNKLTHIPDYVSALHRLSFVDLRNNKISKFPDCLLKLPHLRTVYLDHNQLSAIPLDIDHMHALQNLSLGYNNITKICENLFTLQGLKALCFRGNRNLDSLPAAIKNLISLKKLDLSYCDLQLIPSTISSCTVLRSLFVSNNRLIRVPSEVSQCYRLEHLDVSTNQLTYLPAALLFRQTQLSIQTFGNNFLKKSDPALQWSSVKEILLNYRKHVPSLWSLTRAVVDKFELDTSKLPLTVRNELTHVTSCYHCGKKSSHESVRMIKFLTFDHKPHPLCGLPQEYPFLYTLCTSHLTRDDFMDTLDVCIDASCFL